MAKKKTGADHIIPYELSLHHCLTGKQAKSGKNAKEEEMSRPDTRDDQGLRVSFFFLLFFLFLVIFNVQEEEREHVPEGKKEARPRPGIASEFFLCGILHVQEEERENVHDEKR